jgi:nucleoside diphosphate kinase
MRSHQELADALAALALDESSYYVDQGHHWPLAADLLREIPSHELAGLASLTFVLLKPDAVLSGKVRSALDLLAGAGLAVVDAAVCLTTHPRQFEELYKLNLTVYNQQNMVAAWWLNRQVYDLAPVVTLLLAVPGAGPGEAHRRMAALKGPSSPYRCRPDHLRCRLAASNRSINLLHTSDGPLSTAREVLLFHPWARLREALRRVTLIDPEGGAAGLSIAPDRLEAELATLPGCVLETDFLRILQTVKARLSKLLVEQDALTATAALEAVQREAAMVAAGAAGDEPLLERTRRYRGLSGREVACLREALRDPAAPLARALLALADFDRLDLTTARTAGAALQGAGAYLSPWERLILETSMYYLDDFLAFEPAAESRPESLDRAPALAR